MVEKAWTECPLTTMTVLGYFFWQILKMPSRWKSDQASIDIVHVPERGSSNFRRFTSRFALYSTTGFTGNIGKRRYFQPHRWCSNSNMILWRIWIYAAFQKFPWADATNWKLTLHKVGYHIRQYRPQRDLEPASLDTEDQILRYSQLIPWRGYRDGTEIAWTGETIR